MIDFNDYFVDEYQFTLQKAIYSRIESQPTEESIDLKINDQIESRIVDDKLEVLVQRKVFFVPEALYEITVDFSFILTFRKGKLTQDIQHIDWCEELVTNNNPYIGNVIGRASNVISMLTSSYGQQPLITPPNFIR